MKEKAFYRIDRESLIICNGVDKCYSVAISMVGVAFFMAWNRYECRSPANFIAAMNPSSLSPGVSNKIA